MKQFIVLFFAWLCVLGASAQITPPKKTFYYQKNTKIELKTYDDVVYEPSIGVGKNLVFFYEWQSAKNPQIADADRTDRLYFEITAAQAKSFQASGEELVKVGTIRCRMCFCLEGGCRKSSKGVLTVKKAGCGKYTVTFKDDPESEKFLINETFTAKKGK